MIFSLQRRLDAVAHPSGFVISMTATWLETPVFLRLYSRRSQNGMDLCEERPLFQWWKESNSLGQIMLSQASPGAPTRLWPRNMDSFSQTMLNDGYIDVDIECRHRM